MLRFSFTAFVTDGVLAALADAARCSPTQLNGLRPVIADLFEHIGGLPVCELMPTENIRTQTGLRWVREAVGHRLAELGYRPRARKLTTTAPATDGTVARYSLAHDPIAINEADAQTIQQATGLSLALANEVVAERRRAGRYSTLKEFERRVDGIGPQRAAECAASLQFDDGNRPAWRPTDVISDLRSLLQRQPSAQPLERLTSALDELVTSAATRPHPASRDSRVRRAVSSASGESYEVAWVGELFADSYWPALPSIFDSAQRTIQVCMFHAVAGGKEHPTRKVLESLIRAHQRGVGVRVLLDRDNPTDPYKSTLINASARHLLTEGGVPVRQDLGNRLLHSKFQLIDDKLAVIGSHNWSAGSYFDFDDLTLAIESPEYTTQLRARFDRLWESARP